MHRGAGSGPSKQAKARGHVEGRLQRWRSGRWKLAPRMLLLDAGGDAMVRIFLSVALFGVGLTVAYALDGAPSPANVRQADSIANASNDAYARYKTLPECIKHGGVFMEGVCKEIAGNVQGIYKVKRCLIPHVSHC